MDSRMGLPSRRASSSACASQGCQSTGLPACCRGRGWSRRRDDCGCPASLFPAEESGRLRATIPDLPGASPSCSIENAADEFPNSELKPREDRRLRAGHLWVYSNEVDTAATPLTPSSRVDRARVERRGTIPRLRRRQSPQPDRRAHPGARHRASARAFAAGAPAQGGARAARSALYPLLPRCCSRDGDGLPGLIVDRFGEHVVAQAGTATIEP
jgi:hypothetical protein